jgi:ornithine carbamoyltransferase
MKKRNFLSIGDLDKKEIEKILSLALKSKKNILGKKILKGKCFALIFEKPSLRTRVTFEIAIKSLGADAIFLNQNEIKLGERESIRDVAQNLSQWVDGIIVRTFSHSQLEELAGYSSVPVINALSDKFHPCQVLADVLTIKENNKKFPKIKLVFIGDGNNVAQSWLYIASLLGIDFTLACPKGFEPDKDVLADALKFSGNKSKIEILNNPYQAVQNADVVYTDVWVSMGQEKETNKRIKIFKKFQVNKKLLRVAASNCLIMHCLPAHRGQEITAEVIDGSQSVVLEQAKNRLYAQMGILEYIYK